MSKSILIVDDEPNVRLSYRIVLETEGYVIQEADHAQKALDLITSTVFDLALLDIRMPEMDGLELLGKMRERGFATPVVIITAHGDVPHAVRAMKLGAIDFLQKPLTPQQLREVVEGVLARHEKPDYVAPAADPNLSAEELQALYLQKVKRLLNLQEFGPARKLLSEAMALDSLSAEAFNLAGVLFEMQDDLDRARKYYAQAAKLDRRYEPALQNIRRLHGTPKSEPAHF